MSQRAILIRYNEIALKGGKRTVFEKQLVHNIIQSIRNFTQSENRIQVDRHFGRIVVNTEWNDDTEKALKHVFGISSFSAMKIVKTQKDAVFLAAIEEFEAFRSKNGLPKSFRVRTNRSDKVFADPSMEIDRQIGSQIRQRYPDLTVDLKKADCTIGIEIRRDQSFIWTDRTPGPSGIPVGANGPVLTLISGGLDSPVAALQILKRGSPSYFIHFYGTPFVDEEALIKVQDLAKIVNRYQPNQMPLIIIPFGKIQERIALVTNPKLRTILYRRMMIRISNAVARKIGAKALVTGESLGQVASQTLENLASINSVSELPILRPLIGFDKDEIINLAQKWGTFETSIRPSLDCCTLFADRYPSVRAPEGLIIDQEARFPVDAIVEEIVKDVSSSASV